MAKWLTRLILWPIALVCAIVAGAFFLIQQEPVQQFVARRALTIVNRMIAGSLDVEHVSVRLHGAVELNDVIIRDADGKFLAAAKRVNAWLAPWDIVRGRVHVLKADVDGLRAEFRLDSSGNNVARAFATIPSQEKDSTRKPLWIRLDRLSLDVDSLHVAVDTSFDKSFLSHQLSGDVFLTDSVITFTLSVSQERQFKLDASGVVRPYSDSLFAGDVTFEGTSKYIQSTWAPGMPDLGDVRLALEPDVFRKDVKSTFDVSLSSVGSFEGDVEIEEYASDPRVSLGVAFTELELVPWLGDSVDHAFSGRAALVKSKSPDWTHDWSGRVQLDSSHYGEIELTADVETELFSDGAGLAGEIRTSAGQFNLRLRADGLNPDSLSLYARGTLSNAQLHAFAPVVPDSLSPLSGEAEVTLDRFPEQDLALDATLELGSLSLGRYKLDSLAFHATVNGTDFTLDSTRMRLGGASAMLFARGDYTDRITAEIDVSIPEIEVFRALLSPYVPQLDSLAGDVSLAASTVLTFLGDSLEDLSATGQVRSRVLTFGEIAAYDAKLNCTSFSMADEYASARIECAAITIAEETITPLKLTLDGPWTAPRFSCSLAARGDTLALAASGIASFAASPYSVEIEQLGLDVFGTSWRNDFPVIASFDSLHYEIEALILRSDYGVLRATGYLERPGQQDLVVEFSGLRTGALAPILRTEIPDGDLNVRLQITGADTAVSGNIELVIDSMTYQESLLADRVKLFGELSPEGTLSANAVYSWFGDTTLIATAELPASFSMQTGLTIPEGEQLSGTLQVDSLPLGRFAPWMAAGTILDGFLSANLQLKGSALKPNWDGSVHLDDGFYRDTRYGIAYKWIVLDAELRRDSLLINTLRATSKGTMSGSGFARLGVPWPEELDLNLQFDRFEAVASRIQKARLDGNISLGGPFDSLHAKGKLTIQEGMYRLTQSATKTIEPVDLDSVLAALRGDSADGEFDPDALYESMSLDLGVVLPGNFWIRGAGLNTELFGELRLEKDHYQDATANGEIAIRSGTVKFYGQELRIAENSSFRFDGPVDTPELNVSASYSGVERDRGFEVTVKLTGTPDQSLAEFSGKFDDGTAMSEDEAIARLLPFAKLGDGSGFSAEQSVVDAASGQVSDIVSKASGLDVFEFRPGPGGLSDLSSGQLELGTYVTDRLFIRVFQPIEDPRSGQKVSIDYRLLDWMKLTAEQESRSQATTSSSFTVYLQFEWR